MTHHGQPSETRRTEEHLARHDWDSPGSLYESVVDAVAAATDREAETVAAHYDKDHSRTVERLFADSETPRSYGLVRFTLVDTVLTVHSDGRLVVAPNDGAAVGGGVTPAP